MDDPVRRLGCTETRGCETRSYPSLESGYPMTREASDDMILSDPKRKNANGDGCSTRSHSRLNWIKAVDRHRTPDTEAVARVFGSAL